MSSCSEKNKWLLSLLLAALFIIVACPLTFRLTGFLTKSIGLTTSSDKGCPNWIGLLIHSVVFFLLARALLQLPLWGKESYWAPPIDGRLFMGLADGGRMNAVNGAEIVAQNHGCGECVKACQVCARYPFGKECSDARGNCTLKNCPYPDTVRKVQRGTIITGTPQYTNRGTPQAQCVLAG